MSLPSPTPVIKNPQDAQHAFELIWKERPVSWGYANVASAATVTIPDNVTVCGITGTTNITSVTASVAGRVVVLIFAGALTFTDGSNLKLNGNFVTTADDTITLASNGEYWFEVARSTN